MAKKPKHTTQSSEQWIPHYRNPIPLDRYDWALNYAKVIESNDGSRTRIIERDDGYHVEYIDPDSVVHGPKEYMVSLLHPDGTWNYTTDNPISKESAEDTQRELIARGRTCKIVKVK